MDNISADCSVILFSFLLRLFSNVHILLRIKWSVRFYSVEKINTSIVLYSFISYSSARRTKEDEISSHDELFVTTAALYTTLYVTLQRRLNPQTAVQNVATTTNQVADMRLDPVSIPRFDGKPTNWLAFKDLFEPMVHNRTDLDSAYKLGKLRQCVDQESVPMIGGLYTGGYHEVWSELKRPYDNPRLLSETHLRSFLDLPDNPEEAPNMLRSIVDCVRNSFRALAVTSSIYKFIFVCGPNWELATKFLLHI